MKKSDQKQSLDYRLLKKYLNQYHEFSFKMPRKGKDFTPQQKAAITRKYNQIGRAIKAERTERASFIPYPKGSKLPHIEGIKTNKGIFYKTPGAKAKVVKKGKKKQYIIQVEFGKRKDIFYPFPPHVINDPDQIKEFVRELVKKYKPKTVHLSVYGWRTKPRYDPEGINFYQAELTKYNLKEGKTAPKFDGVWLIF